jgi:hypothetical protein
MQIGDEKERAPYADRGMVPVNPRAELKIFGFPGRYDRNENAATLPLHRRDRVALSVGGRLMRPASGA